MRGYHPHLIRGEFAKTNDADGFQLVDVLGLDGETLSQVYRPQPYGLSAHAPVGSNGLLVSFGGERTNSMLVGGDLPGKRPFGLNEGDVKLYDQSGNIVFMGQKNGISLSTGTGDIVAKTNNGKITITPDGHYFCNPTKDNNVYLGLAEPGGARVLTESGPAKNVYAMTGS